MVLIAPFGAIRGYRSIHAHGPRRGIGRGAAPSAIETCEGDDRFRHAVPGLVQAAAMLAGAGQFGSYGLAALGLFYAIAVLVSQAPLGLVVALLFGLTLPPLAMGYASQRYLRVLVAGEALPPNLAVWVLAVFGALVLVLVGLTRDPRWLALGVPVLGIVLLLSHAAQIAQKTRGPKN